MKFLTIILTIIVHFNSFGQTNLLEIKIDLSGKHLITIPDSILLNTDITFLNLGSKNVTFYPPLSALKDSNSNNIANLPEEIGNLTKLKILILNTNKLKSLPNSIIKLKNLEVLDLSINEDLDIIQQLDKLKQLHNLKILKIVSTKLNQDKISLVKASLRPDIKIVFSILEYLELSQ